MSLVKDTSQVKIDFKHLGVAFRDYVREKALKADSTIVDREGSQQIEENPRTGEKKILKEYNYYNS